MNAGNTSTRFAYAAKYSDGGTTVAAAAPVNPYFSSVRYAMLRRSRTSPRSAVRTTLRFVDGGTLQDLRNQPPGLVGATPSVDSWGIEQEAHKLSLRSPGTFRQSKPLELHSGIVVTVSGFDGDSVRQCARSIVEASGFTPDTPSPRRKHRQASASGRLAAQRNDALLDGKLNSAYWADAWSEVTKGTVALHCLALVELHGKRETMASLSLVEVGNRPSGYAADAWAIDPQRKPILPSDLLGDILEFLEALPDTD